MRKCLVEPSLRINTRSCSIPISQPKPSFLGEEAVESTPSTSRTFHNLGMVEIDITLREIIREAIKLLGDTQQYLLHVRLDGEFRQSPGVLDLCMTAG